MCGESRDRAYLDSHPWVSNPYKEEHYNLRGPPQGVRILSEGSPALHQKEEPQEHLAFKTSRAYVQENWRTTGNTESLLTKGACRISPILSPSGEAAVWK